MANLHRIGELNPRSKLNDEERRMIPVLAKYLKQAEIAALFNMNASSISSILSGRYKTDAYKRNARARIEKRNHNVPS